MYIIYNVFERIGLLMFKDYQWHAKYLLHRNAKYGSTSLLCQRSDKSPMAWLVRIH